MDIHYHPVVMSPSPLVHNWKPQAETEQRPRTLPRQDAVSGGITESWSSQLSCQLEKLDFHLSLEIRGIIPELLPPFGMESEKNS